MESLTDYKKKENRDLLLKKEVAKNEIFKINSRAFISGNIIEIYQYGQPVWAGFRSYGGRKMSNEKVTSKENRSTVLYRIRNDLRRLINANFCSGSKFITLTFKENVTDLKVANYEFKKFIDRLKYRIETFKYLAVIEFQKRDAIHYHMISNLGYFRNKDLRELWGNGYIKINRIKNCDNVGAYMIKYINKDLDDTRLHGRKAYLRSENLGRPKELINNSVIRLIEKNDLESVAPVYSNVFKTEYYGMVGHREYNLKQSSTGKKIRDDKFIKECKKLSGESR